MCMVIVMNILMFFLVVFIFACSILLLFTNWYNEFQNCVIRLNEAEANIDSVLRKRFDLLNKSINIIKTNAELDDNEEVLGDIVKLRSRKLSNFELDRKLYDSINEFQNYKEKYEQLKTCESYLKIEIALNDSEAEVYACRNYYNDIVTRYNKLVRAFPSNILAFLLHYKEKTYFDGKDMNDDIKNDFKL